MVKKSFLIFLLFSLTIACKSAKNTTDKNIKNLNSRKIIQKHYNQNFDNQYLKAGLSIKYKGQSEIPELRASLRIIKDSAIWMSISKFGFPVGKLLITPNRVKFYEKINKTYFDGDFTFISNLIGAEFDFKKVQNLFFGDALIDLKQQKYNATIDQSKYLLFPKKKNPIFDVLFWIDPTSFKIYKEEFNKVQSNQKLRVVYKKYSLIDGLFLPEDFTIEAIGNKNATQIKIGYKSIAPTQILKVPFTIPKNYKRRKLK